MNLSEKSLVTENLSYKSALSLKDESAWQSLKDMTVEDALNCWLNTFQPLTKKNYTSGVNKLVEIGLLNPFDPLQSLVLVNHEAIVDRIKLADGWSELTKQARAACYISFTGFLQRRTQGLIRKAMPSKEGASKTFYRTREKVATNAMNQKQWISFLEALEKINHRDCLIAKIILQGGKRISEVLTLTTDQIDWDNNLIKFKQAKTKGLVKEIVIHYSKDIMNELAEYIGKRNGIVFVTKTNKPIFPIQLTITFAKAGKRAGLPFNISPHVLRASTVTHLKKQGFSDSDIMKVTGHASSEAVNAYDKSQQADNITKKVKLF